MVRRKESKYYSKGQSWGSKWAPEQGGARGRNGDRICQIAAKELRASNIPSEEFPLGLQVSYGSGVFSFSTFFLVQIGALYNFCGAEEWKDSKYRRTERICCEVRLGFLLTKYPFFISGWFVCLLQGKDITSIFVFIICYLSVKNIQLNRTPTILFVL